MNYRGEKQYDKLYEEFPEFKTISDDEIDLTDAILSTYEDDNIEYRMDTVWYNLQHMRFPVGSN